MKLISKLHRLLGPLAALLCLLALPARATELMMVETPGCGWCRQWHAEIGPGYPKTAEGRFAPLRRHQLGEPFAGVVLRSAVVSTPTFIVVDGGKEIGRIIGYPGAEFFYGLLDEILARLPDWKVKNKSAT